MPGCGFRVVGKPIKTKVYALAFPKKSLWKEPISKLMLKYERKDYFRALTHKWFSGSCLTSKSSAKTIEAYRMEIFNVAGLFVICCGTALLCGLLLALEVLWYHKVTRRRCSYST